MPLLPFVCALVGVLAAGGLRGSRARTAVVLGLVVVQAAAVFAIRPDYLAYFNAIAGGPEGGRRWLNDSNLTGGRT